MTSPSFEGGPDDPPAPELGATPDQESLRIRLIRRLLSLAVRHYREALEFAREVDLAMPERFRPLFSPAALPEEEREAWWNLVYEANSQFFDADSALAERIDNLYNLLARGGNIIDPREAGRAFIERGVSLGGSIYILTGDPDSFEPREDRIAIVRTDCLVSLDE